METDQDQAIEKDTKIISAEELASSCTRWSEEPNPLPGMEPLAEAAYSSAIKILSEQVRELLEKQRLDLIIALQESYDRTALGLETEPVPGNIRTTAANWHGKAVAYRKAAREIRSCIKE